jgi:hypothetical protein
LASSRKLLASYLAYPIETLKFSNLVLKESIIWVLKTEVKVTPSKDKTPFTPPRLSINISILSKILVTVLSISIKKSSSIKSE